MKILMVMDPGIMIPVKGYGGIERVIEMLALEHVSNGHEVHLLITTGSSVEGCIVHDLGKEGFPPDRRDAKKSIRVVWKFLWKNRNEFDLVHNFGRLIYLLPILNHPVKKIMSYQREITPKNIERLDKFPQKNLILTGCSQNLINRNKLPGNWEAVYNACNFSKYRLQKDVPGDAPLIFLGRIEKIKGCHTAIKVAKASGNTLIIAGNVSSLPEERMYYETEIAPHVDGKQIQFIGTVNDVQKNEWLGKAKALLFPIEWNEPFGIVMIEAMACGTLVIGFNKGSVNEVIDEGITGFKVDTEEQMIKALEKINTISRPECRRHAMSRFDVSIIAKQYLHIIDENRKRIVIISTHQPAANPRALKEYESLKKEGYSVKQLYAYNADWSYRIDEEKFRSGMLPRQDFIEIGGNPYERPIQYLVSRLLRRSFWLFSGFNFFCKAMGTAKGTFEIWRRASKYPADLYIAHYLGSLPGALKASQKNKAGLIFDAEDFHRGEHAYYPGQMKDVITVEDRLLPGVDLITTASPLITKEYKKIYPQINIVTVDNVFSKTFLQPSGGIQDVKLHLFWFSQYIGRYRGLEIFIKALNFLSDANITLTIMGNTWSVVYKRHLLGLARRPEQISFKEAAPPEAIFSIAADYDIGLAGEIPNCHNKEICLSNKIFTYLLAGNCILASDMQGQREFMEQYPGIGFTYKHDDPKDLANKISMLHNDRKLLQRCKQQSLKLAADELNWEREGEGWLKLINKLLSKKIVSLAENKKAAQAV